VTIHSARLRPPSRRPTLGDYDLDAVTVEYDEESQAFDFRFELGQGLGIYWALPIERNGRLRLVHVDGAAYTVDEPELIADPWICDLPRLEWREGLATFRDGTRLLSVEIDAREKPAWYRCKIALRDRQGKERDELFEWHAPARMQRLGSDRPTLSEQPLDPATDALLNGLIDAYVRWDDSDRVAACEAREAAVARRDAAILDLAYIESGQRGDAPMDVAVAKMAAHFAARIERDVPDVGTFAPIHQPLPEIENGGYIALDLKPADSARVLELRVESPSGEHTSNEVLRSGSTAELVRYLRAAAFPGQLVPIMQRLTEATRESE
jgi:hypothetical protein